MERIISWLSGVEERVAELYRQGAGKFSGDPEFARFLEDIAEQEMEHARIIREAFDGADLSGVDELSVVIDEATRATVAAGLDDAMAKVSAAGLSRETMATIVADIEFHEWNGIFLYAMKVLKGHGLEYGRALLALEQHLSRIETCFATFPYGRRLLAEVRKLSALGRFKVLVVEDDPVLADLIRHILVRDAVMTLARNGREGLEQIRTGAFDVIVTDVDMPVMDGVELFQEAIRGEPGLGERFLFLTASQRPELRGFFAEHRLPALTKPSPISRIRQAVVEIAGRGHEV